MVLNILSAIGYFIIGVFLRVFVFVVNTTIFISKHFKKKTKPMSVYQQDKDYRESIFSQYEQ